MCQGEVLLDGHPLDGWNRDELGSHLGYLPQDIELFDGTHCREHRPLCRDRFRPGDCCCASAGLHEMILRFPKGYDTPIGEARRSLLSGGQRQRIGWPVRSTVSLALIVLDEPNANLDDVGEAALNQTVRELKAKGKTVFLITHRPGAVQLADQLLVLQEGRIAMQGPRAVVLAQLQARRRPRHPGRRRMPCLPRPEPAPATAVQPHMS